MATINLVHPVLDQYVHRSTPLRPDRPFQSPVLPMPKDPSPPFFLSLPVPTSIELMALTSTSA